MTVALHPHVALGEYFVPHFPNRVVLLVSLKVFGHGFVWHQTTYSKAMASKPMSGWYYLIRLECDGHLLNGAMGGSRLKFYGRILKWLSNH